MQPDDIFFAHHGVKGMKWGVRKDGTSTGRKKAKTSLSKRAASLSDDALRTKVKRLNLEKRYVDLKSGKIKRDRTAVEKGKVAVKKAMSKAAQDQLNNLSKAAMTTAVEIGSAHVKKKAQKVKWY